MIKTFQRLRPILLFSIPFLLLLSVTLITQSRQYLDYSRTISPYLILDLLVTIPFIYFLIIRKTKIPNTTVVPMVFFGLIMGYYILPIEEHYFLDLFKKNAIPVIEISVFIIVILKVRKTVSSFKANKKQGIDFYDVLQETCKEIIPGRMSVFLASEISVVYYGFLNWGKPVLTKNDFTYHKKSGSPALFGALIFIVVVETLSVHIILLQWSHLAAIILSILSIYTGIQLLGFSRSLSQRPITIDKDTLILRYGILNESFIRISDIESVELSRKTLKYNDEVRKFSLLGDLESHNVIIRCKNTQVIEGIYGIITRSYSTLALHIDERERFKEMIEDEMRKLISG